MPLKLERLHVDLRQPVEAERTRTGRGEIDNTAMHVRPTVVDTNDDGFPVALVGDLHAPAERKASSIGAKAGAIQR